MLKRLCILSALLLAAFPLVAAPVVPDVSQATFDWTGLDTANATEGPVTGEIALFAAGADPNVATPVATGTLATVVALPGQNSFTITSSFLDGVGAGNYDFRVRLVDEAGNVSAWSNAAPMEVDINPPAAPTNVSVQ